MDPLDFVHYLERYPVGIFSSNAREKLSGIDKWNQVPGFKRSKI